MDCCWMILLPLLALAPKVFVVAHQDDNKTGIGNIRNKIVTAQFECYQKITKDTKLHRRVLGDSVCNSTWDGWLCWNDVEAGVTSEQHCPDYYHDFDPLEVATKICTEKGEWFQHPTSNRTWTNYTRCHLHTHDTRKTTLNQYYLVLIGNGLSLISLFISLGIFFHFKSLSCQRITLHKNLFLSFILNSVCTIILFTAVANNEDLVHQNPVSCKVSQFLHLYLLGCNYFWMLCEGIYLHTLIVVAVFAEKQHLMWYYLLGWGFPLVPALIHAIARSYYYNDNCWLSSSTTLLYIIHGPIGAALLVNLFFLLNIIRVLITKLKVTHQAESSLYMKAVRATLILVPLLGIQFVLVPYKPVGRASSEIHAYVMNILMHFQGLLVATIFCFFNGEVQSVLRRHWNQYRIQFRSTLAHPEALRSASYTVSSMTSSMTEVHRCYSIDGHTEHLNGRGYTDIDNTTIFRNENLYA
ncbi:calcitonin gene-related peptide type 1 receptor [Alosa sapidissima]|uniref:calcitonin gene-related peptide type 1 receptor n=1 Tax=Alosa sapidissima TaxID=34773 RepID=UPI001C09CFC0|nr:calcitonin gene-related peptide type 1 receptor [Alosa sapidissima]